MFLLLGFKKLKDHDLNQLLGFDYFNPANNCSVEGRSIAPGLVKTVLEKEKKLSDLFTNFEVSKLKEFTSKLHFFCCNKFENFGRIAVCVKVLVRQRNVIVDNIFPTCFKNLIKRSSGRSAKIYAATAVGDKQVFSLALKLARVKFAKLENINGITEKRIKINSMFKKPISKLIRSFNGAYEIHDSTPSLRVMNLLIN